VKREKRRIAVASWDTPWGLRLHGSGEKAKPRQKQRTQGSGRTLTLKTVFRFFLGTSVGIPKSFRAFRLFPRQRLVVVGASFKENANAKKLV
jgi:hypothetical protein